MGTKYVTHTTYNNVRDETLPEMIEANNLPALSFWTFSDELASKPCNPKFSRPRPLWWPVCQRPTESHYPTMFVMKTLPEMIEANNLPALSFWTFSDELALKPCNPKYLDRGPYGGQYVNGQLRATIQQCL
jgi:hypothetical protein